MLDEFDLEHGAGTCTRAANEPSQSLKFYNHVDVEGPYYGLFSLLKVATTTN